MKFIVCIGGLLLALSGCVSQKVFTASQYEVLRLRADSLDKENQIQHLKLQVAQLTQYIKDLETQNTQLGSLTEEQKELLYKNQKELQRQQQRYTSLQSLLEQQKQASQLLKNKMADALKGFSSSELTVVQKDGKVYVSLSENLLFPSASAVVNPKGVEALSKLAQVLNTNPDVKVNIEGHTDSIPVKIKFQDNWELSTARANAIVRILVNDYKVDPARVVASGHSWYEPVADNQTEEGRSKNRRTEIILTPKLEELYDLLSP